MAQASIIESIKAKVYRLMAENRRLGEECLELIQMRDRLKVENREMAERIAGMEKRIKMLELKEGMAGAGDNTKQARARINHLMREIDKCVALMNR